MSTIIRKYINKEDESLINSETACYIDPSIINKAVVGELNLSMSFDEIYEFIKNASITLTSEEIEKFLDSKMSEDEPGLKEKLEEIKRTSSIIIFSTDEEENNLKTTASLEKMKDILTASKYYFNPESLNYLKKYISILKIKCATLFDILKDLGRIKIDSITEEKWKRLLDLDFHINENGDIYIEDAERLLAAIVYNVNDLYNKVSMGNDVQTYLTFKGPKIELFNDDIFKCNAYPSEKVQSDNIDCDSRQYIALSQHQKEVMEQEIINNMLSWINDIDDEIGVDDQVVVKKKTQ